MEIKEVKVWLFVLTHSVTKNCGVSCVTWKIRECANFVSNLLAYLIRAFSICKKFRKMSFRNFRLGRENSICHKSNSFAGPSPSLHQNTRCLAKMFCYVFERVFVPRFPVKQMLIIGMCCYEKSDICMFPSF